MLTEINGTIQIAGDKIVLVKKEDDYEEFKKYEHPADPKKFYADFSLGNKQLCINGSLKEIENQKDSTVIIPISSARKLDNRKAFTAPEDIKALFGLNNKKEINVQMFKHPRKRVVDGAKAQEVNENGQNK